MSIHASLPRITLCLGPADSVELQFVPSVTILTFLGVEIVVAAVGLGIDTGSMAQLLATLATGETGHPSDAPSTSGDKALSGASDTEPVEWIICVTLRGHIPTVALTRAVLSEGTGNGFADSL